MKREGYSEGRAADLPGGRCASKLRLEAGTGRGRASRKTPRTTCPSARCRIPDVKRFQEMFPDAQVRAVRNLKE